MHFISLTILAFASLSAAAPFYQNSFNVTVAKRHKDTSSCGLTDHPSTVQKASFRIINSFLSGLRDYDSRYLPQQAVFGNPGQTKMIACGPGGTAVWLCVKSRTPSCNCTTNIADHDIAFNSVQIGFQLKDVYEDCYGGFPDKSSSGQVAAFQFWGNGFNLLMAGGADCSKIGQLVGPC